MGNETDESGLRVTGTAYFRRVDGSLRRALHIQLPVPFSGPAQAQVVIGGETTGASFSVTNGQAMLVGPTPHDQPTTAYVTATCEAGTWTGAATLPPARLWTIYVAQDKHLDYGWIHPVEKVVERMNTLIDYHLDAAHRLGLRWNLDTSIWVDEFLRSRPSTRAEQLLSALRSGDFEAGAFWLVPLAGLMGSEELLQSLTYARHLHETFGIPVRTASLQEVPSLPWGLATILAGAGFSYIVKGAYNLRNPHLHERDPLPLAFWEGPDGGRVLMKWDAYQDTHTWGGYAEAYALWRSPSDEARLKFIEDTIARYEGYRAYPFDAILLAGTGFDEYPQTTVVSEFIQWFNAQGWEYPRLVDATWNQFWLDIERQLETGRAQVPVIRGDWGTTWEEWPAQLAHLSTAYRRARETVLAAQTLAALAYKLDPATHPTRGEALACAWRGLLQFTDHNIGGISEVIADDMRDRKAMYAYTAAREGARALEGGLATLAAHVSRAAAGERRLLVANPNSWLRSAVVEVMVPEPGPCGVVDMETGQAIPGQLETRGAWPEHYLSFLAPDVPAFGYRTFTVRRGPGSAILPQAAPSDPAMENRFYRLAVDSHTGGLCSLWDAVTQRELVAAGADRALNQYLYFSDGALHRPQLETVTIRQGPISTSLSVEASCLRTKLRITYLLYDGLDQVGILNELTKEPSAEPQCSWFLFPFDIPNRQYYYDGPAAILRPGLQADGGDLLPGSGRTCIAVQSFLAAAGFDLSVILATPDAYLVQLGEQALRDPLADADPRHPLAPSLAMHNFTRNDHAVAQGGQTHFAFRYGIFSEPGPFQSNAALRFTKEVAQPLPAAWVTGGDSAPLKAARHSFLSVTPGHVVATGLKVAEDGHGWVLRLWECEGRAAEVAVDIGGLGARRAWRCDLLERTQDSLAVRGGAVRLTMPARGLQALRFE